MSFLKAVKFGIEDKIQTDRLRKQRKEAIFVIIRVVAALLFVVSTVISIINIIETSKKRIAEYKENKKERKSLYNKKITFNENEDEQAANPAEASGSKKRISIKQ